MKNRCNKIIAVLVLIMLFSFGCKPKDCHKDGTCAEDYRRMPLGEAKEYLYALPGSYWIYKNSISGELDTQICQEFSLDTVIKSGTTSDTKHITVEYESIKRIIYSSFNKSTYEDVTGFYNPNAMRPLKTVVSRYLNGQGNILFFHPFIESESFGNGPTMSKFIELDSNLKIDNLTFNEVAKFDVDIDLIWRIGSPYTSSSYYWAKNVGLIKIQGKNYNLSWILTDYKIIK